MVLVAAVVLLGAARDVALAAGTWADRDTAIAEAAEVG